MLRKTKIICTIGPASENEETLTAMCQAGMNVARLNFSHGSYEEHLRRIQLIRSVREKLNLPIAIMLDTKGPEYRIKTFANGPVTLHDGDLFTLTTEDIQGDETRVAVTYANLTNELFPGDTVLINNGLVIMKVEEVKGNDVICRVQNGGVLSDRKSMNFPGKVLKQDFLSEQDKKDLLFGIEQDVDFVACSFVSTAQDVIDVRRFLDANGGKERRVMVIPTSAHGTNPASAAMAGFDIVLVGCDEHGNINVEELREKAEAAGDTLAGMMITYPSTHGVFEVRIREIVDIIHRGGGLLYMDGANMNAQVGLTNPGYIGADVCHLNLHKTFAMPHGGGGPGVGPICCTAALKPYLPGHPVVGECGGKGMDAVSAAPYGSPLLLPITHAYIKMLGAEGLRKVTQIAILNANYMSAKLLPELQTLYTGATGRVAHECIIDLRAFKATYGVDATDVAKRLMDFGFHAPTLSFPVHETLMIEPTESEPLGELDRFVETLKAIVAECEDIKAGKLDAEDNPVRMAPHTEDEVCADTWNHAYSRTQAAFPLEWIRENKLWPAVSRVDNGYGDRNLVTTVD